MNTDPCTHPTFLQIITKCSDRCDIIFFQQRPDVRPIETRVSMRDVFEFPRHDYDDGLADHCGYCPKIPGIGSGDYMALHVCTICKVVIGFPTKSIDEWKAIIEPLSVSNDEEHDEEE